MFSFPVMVFKLSYFQVSKGHAQLPRPHAWNTEAALQPVQALFTSGNVILTILFYTFQLQQRLLYIKCHKHLSNWVSSEIFSQIHCWFVPVSWILIVWILIGSSWCLKKFNGFAKKITHKNEYSPSYGFVFVNNLSTVICSHFRPSMSKPKANESKMVKLEGGTQQTLIASSNKINSVVNGWLHFDHKWVIMIFIIFQVKQEYSTKQNLRIKCEFKFKYEDSY